MAKKHQSPASLICEAIRTHSLLEFHYHDKLRVVAPYCYGTSTRGTDVLRAIQVRGQSSSRSGLGFGKLWTVTDMLGLKILHETFTPNDPNYNPDDSAMTKIHCRIGR